jgi:hypothetical protein
MADPRSWVAVSRRGDQRLLTALMEKHEKMGLDAAGLSGGRVRLIHAFGSADEQVGLAAIT